MGDRFRVPRGATTEKASAAERVDIEREVLPIDGLCWTAMSRQPMTVATSTALGGSGTLDIRYLVTSCMKNVIAQ
jgi:hypothetical protein